MATIAVLYDRGEGNLTTFSAITTGRQATGRTVGEALNKLISQLDVNETGTTVIVQQLQPDHLFTSEQRNRLSDLMTHWRAARDTRTALSPVDQAELERLVDEELLGATKRSAKILNDHEMMPKLRHETEKAAIELRAILEKERRRVSQLHRATLAVNAIGLLLIMLATVFLVSGSISGGLTPLIASAVLSAIQVLLLRYEEAAYNRANSLYSQVEVTTRLAQLEDISDLLESSTRSSKRIEQTRAQ